MTDPVSPIAGAYPPPALVSRTEAAAAPEAPSRAVQQAPRERVMAHAALPGVVLAGPGWVPVLHSAPRRGLRADEAERRRYRASYASASATPSTVLTRNERRA